MSQAETDYTEYTLGRSRHDVVDPEIELDQIKQLQESENDQIGEEYRGSIEGRGRRSTLSPSYINSRPRTLAEKLHVTPEEEEHILFIFAGTYSIQQTAKSCGVTQDKVRSVVYNPEMRERIQIHRDAMRMSVLSKIEESQYVLLDAMQDPDKLKNSSITQISEVFQEISEVQGNIVTSMREAANPATTVDPIKLFTGDELEYMAMLRKRIGSGDNGPKEYPNLDAPLSSVEADFTLLESTPLDDDLDPWIEDALGPEPPAEEVD